MRLTKIEGEQEVRLHLALLPEAMISMPVDVREAGDTGQNVIPHTACPLRDIM